MRKLLAIDITQEKHYKLKSNALSSQITLSQYVNKLIDNGLDEQKEEVKPEIFADAVINNAILNFSDENKEKIKNTFDKYFRHHLIETLKEF